MPRFAQAGAPPPPRCPGPELLCLHDASGPNASSASSRGCLAGALPDARELTGQALPDARKLTGSICSASGLDLHRNDLCLVAPPLRAPLTSAQPQALCVLLHRRRRTAPRRQMHTRAHRLRTGLLFNFSTQGSVCKKLDLFAVFLSSPCLNRDGLPNKISSQHI